MLLCWFRSSRRAKTKRTSEPMTPDIASGSSRARNNCVLGTFASKGRSLSCMSQSRGAFAEVLRGIEQSIHESLDDAFESNSSTRREDAGELLRKSESALRTMLDRTTAESDRRSIVGTLSHVQDLQDQLTISRRGSHGQPGLASPIARLIHARRRTDAAGGK